MIRPGQAAFFTTASDAATWLRLTAAPNAVAWSMVVLIMASVTFEKSMGTTKRFKNAHLLSWHGIQLPFASQGNLYMRRGCCQLIFLIKGWKGESRRWTERKGRRMRTEDRRKPFSTILDCQTGLCGEKIAGQVLIQIIFTRPGNFFIECFAIRERAAQIVPVTFHSVQHVTGAKEHLPVSF